MPTAPTTIAMPAGVGRLGIQLLLTAEVMLFAGLIAAFAVLKNGNAAVVAVDRQMLDRWIVPAVTSLAVASTVLAAGRRSTGVLLGVVGIGLVYLLLMVMQWASLERSRTDVFYACYFVITAALAAHVVASMIATIDAAVRADRGTLSAERVQCIALLWHFATAVGVVTMVLLHWA